MSKRANGHQVAPTTTTAPRADVQITRLPDSDIPVHDARRTTYHIYDVKQKHRRIQTVVDIKKESPLSTEGRKARKARKEAKKTGVVIELETSGDVDDAFFLHSPYVAFHGPPKVLYAGQDKHATPAILIHGSAFWRRYTLQYGDSIATPGVLDPRGVVCWKHNGGDKKALKADARRLKGYKVRTWRLWGETGKAYVHQVKANRKARIGPDPDVLVDPTTGEIEQPILADGVVYLKWERPFSRHTRRYHFEFGGIDFSWKGTGSVEKSKHCGFCLRFAHLKLVAKLPTDGTNQKDRDEVCLALYVCSMNKKKCGRLEIFDNALLRLTEDYLEPVGEIGVAEEEAEKVKRLKKTMLYKIVIATAMCMIAGEKEKREMVYEWLQEAGEGAGG